MVNKIIASVCAAAIFMQPLFFSFMGLLGIEYEGSESSIIYVAYVVTIAGLSLVAYIYATVKKGVLKGEAIFLALIIGLFALHAVWVIFDPLNTPLFPQFLIFFLLFGMPGFLSAATVIKLDTVPNLIRISELLVVLIASGIVLFSVLPSLAGIRTASIAGASYQALSYYAAFSFGMLLTYNVHLPKYLRLKFTSQIWYRLASYMLMLGCVIACFLGGGRGAFLLLLVYLVMVSSFMFLDRKNIRTRRGLVNTTFKLTSITLVVATFITMFWENEFIQSGFNRVTQFISADGGIDLERGSSGRDVVYRIALEYIEHQPLLGYGPFSYFERTIQAHNIFLDVWLQFGIIGLILFIIFGVRVVIRLFKYWTDSSFWVLSLLLYPSIMLMFSGSYLHTGIYIFSLSYIMMNRNSIQLDSSTIGPRNQV